MSNTGQKLKGLSLSYVQDEDRLLLEILLEGASRPLWITRAASLRLIDIFNERLSGVQKKPDSKHSDLKNTEAKSVDSSVSQTPEKKAPVAFERDIAATKNPPKRGEMKLNLEQVRSGETRVGVLKTMQFAQLDGQPVLYHINFIDTHGLSIGLKMTRDLLLNLETLLIQQVERARW